MQVDKEMLSKHIYFLAKRPGMYVSEITFENIATHLDGYFMGIMAMTEMKMFSSWRYWIAMKYGIWSPAWSWSKTIRAQVNSDSEAIELLPRLFNEFISEYAASGDGQIERMHNEFEFEHRES